ncbi:major capsid protein [Elizabethkingia anophelis]|nr:major capsid protein [Elizabethkingia anophelis]MDV3585530.1 major capsid protein E [Elizabethkingia anophelis]MDV3786255.1 major capsid protein E [Elizabethkingia anophelis]
MKINAQNIIPEFRAGDFGYILENNPLGDLQYRNYFPLEYNTSLDFGNIEASTGAKIMANVVSFGSRAPRKGREFASLIKGELPKIEIARDQDEFDLFKVDELREKLKIYKNNTSIGDKLASLIYDDPLFCLNGVNARLEWLAKQIASTGKVKLDKITNAAGAQNFSIDFKVRTESVGKKWDQPDAKPIDDLKALQADALGKGFTLLYATTDLATANKITQLQNVKEFVYGVVTSGTAVLFEPTLEQLNAKLREKNLPIFRVWNSVVSEEDKSGKITPMSGWETGNILFTVDSTFGNTQYTVSKEFTTDLKGTISRKIVDDAILIKTWGEEDPIMFSTKGVAYAFTVMNNTKKSVILKVL